MRINKVITYQVTSKNPNVDIGLPQEIIDQLEGNDHHPPKPQPTFGYKWKAKALYKKGKLPTVKYDVSGRKLTSKNATIDHVVPHSKGGKTEDGNLMLATKEFNQLRGNKPLLEFITYEGLLKYVEQFIDVFVDGFNGNKYVKELLNTINNLSKN